MIRISILVAFSLLMVTGSAHGQLPNAGPGGQPPNTPPSIAWLQDSKKTPGENFTGLQAQLPKLVSNHDRNLVDIPTFKQKVEGKVAFARMVDKHEAKVTIYFKITTVALASEANGTSFQALSVSLKCFENVWTTTSFDCSWSKVGGTPGFNFNELALPIMLAIDKTAPDQAK